MQWPPRELCSACHNELNGQVPLWDLGATLNFLKAHFSPANIVLDSPAPGPAARSGSPEATPNLVMGPFKLEMRNSVLGHEQATSADPLPHPPTPEPAEKPEASGPQELDTGLRVGGSSPGQGPLRHGEELQRDRQESAQGQRHLRETETGSLLAA